MEVLESSSIEQNENLMNQRARAHDIENLRNGN